MYPKTITVTGVGTSAWIPMDRHQTPFNVGFGVVINSGTATYTVEHTFTNVLDPNAPTPVAFPNSTVAAQTANKDGNYAFPIAALRLNVTASSGGTVSITLIQGSVVS